MDDDLPPGILLCLDKLDLDIFCFLHFCSPVLVHRNDQGPVFICYDLSDCRVLFDQIIVVHPALFVFRLVKEFKCDLIRCQCLIAICAVYHIPCFTCRAQGHHPPQTRLIQCLQVFIHVDVHQLHHRAFETVFEIIDTVKIPAVKPPVILYHFRTELCKFLIRVGSFPCASGLQQRSQLPALIDRVYGIPRRHALPLPDKIIDITSIRGP